MNLTRSILIKIRKKQTFIQIVGLFSLVCLAILTITTFLLSSLFSTLAVKEISENNQSLLNRTAESTTFAMQWTLSYIIKSEQDPDIFAYALQSYSDPMNDNIIWNKIRALKENQSFIDSIYVFNGRINSVVDTNYGVSTLKSFYDQDIIAILQKPNMPNTLRILPRHLAATINSKSVTKDFITIIIPYDTDSNISAFIVNLDTRKINNFIGVLPNSNNSKLLLVNEANVIISSPQESSFMQKVPDEVSEIGNPTSSSGANRKVDGLSSVILFADVPIIPDNQWRLVQIIPENDILRKVNAVKLTALLVYAAFLVISGFVIWILSRKIYSPIERLVQEVNFAQNGEEMNPEGEVSLLRKVFVQQKTHLNSLSLFKRNYEFFAKGHALKELLANSANYPINKMIALVEEHKIDLSLEGLIVIVFRIDNYSLFSETYNYEDQRLMRYAITNIVQEHLIQSFKVECADPEGDHIAAIVNADESSSLLLRDQVEQCQSSIRQYLNISVTAAVSELVENYLELQVAYIYAYGLTDDRFLHGGGRIFWAEHSKDAVKALQYSFPEGKARKVLDELKLGHAELCLKHLESFVEQLGQYPQAENRLYYTQFLFEFGKTLNHMKIATSEQPVWNLRFIQAQIELLENSRQVHEWIEKQILAAFSAMENNLKTAKNSGLTVEIESIILAHLSDPNLSTKLIADKIGLSIKYLRVLFKEETGDSISDFITNKRLDRVTELLLKSDKPVEEIAYECGFPALNSFYLVFKKKFGIPPSQYRRNHGKGLSQ